VLTVHSFYEMACLDHQGSVRIRHRRQQQAMGPASRHRLLPLAGM
jgi:hypothetical protein